MSKNIDDIVVLKVKDIKDLSKYMWENSILFPEYSLYFDTVIDIVDYYHSNTFYKIYVANGEDLAINYLEGIVKSKFKHVRDVYPNSEDLYGVLLGNVHRYFKYVKIHTYVISKYEYLCDTLFQKSTQYSFNKIKNLEIQTNDMGEILFLVDHYKLIFSFKYLVGYTLIDTISEDKLLENEVKPSERNSLVRIKKEINEIKITYPDLTELVDFVIESI